MVIIWGRGSDINKIEWVTSINKTIGRLETL
jgi:hypothetical protein